MPCFKGLAVSIHTPEGPLAEHSIQKNTRVARISSYIAVPQPQLSAESGRTEPSTFAVSITLLVPSQAVPYSRPPPTLDTPYPEPKFVSSFPGLGEDRGRNTVTGPYIPLTASSNETIAAYIHFDGRAKEEVATLLRRGEETWVNSRWVSVPESEGGGLAEREFLFREVGLERWLNGLDLKGERKEVAERIERRKQRLEKKRQQKLAEQHSSDDELNDGEPMSPRTARRKANILRYGDDKSQPIESLDEDMSFDDSDPEDEMPVPEAAGQIKISLYRVLASGEIKRGEYSPQFDAHDDSDKEVDGSGSGNGNGSDVDHTTTFAKPKSLDPKSISTQTVTGIDPPEKPFATFTFFYRGKKQLQKMGILQGQNGGTTPPTVPPRKSKQLDASNLGSLKSTFGTVGFSSYRDANARAADPLSKKKKKASPYNDSDMDEDSDDEDGDTARSNVANGTGATDKSKEDDKDMMLSAEEVNRRGELADGVKKMQLKRQHSFEAQDNGSTGSNGGQEVTGADLQAAGSPASLLNGASSSGPGSHLAAHLSDPSAAASPFKKARASVSEKEPIASFNARLNAAGLDNKEPANNNGPAASTAGKLQPAAPIGSSKAAETKKDDDDEL